MQTGKISEIAYKRSVLKKINNKYLICDSFSECKKLNNTQSKYYMVLSKTNNLNNIYGIEFYKTRLKNNISTLLQNNDYNFILEYYKIYKTLIDKKEASFEQMISEDLFIYIMNLNRNIPFIKEMQEYFEIGQIVNTFGVKGFVKVKPFTDDLERFEELESILVIKNKDMIEMKIEEVKYQKNMVLLKLEGIDDMTMAEKYKGCYIKIHRKDARELEEGTYFIADILGSDVYTDTGDYLGKVDDIYNSGAQDIYVVKDELGKQILLPSIKEVILDIDIENQKVTVHLLKGLI